MKVKNGKYFSALSIGIASVWFSSHCGAGFASGTQEVSYYVRHGWTAVILPIFSMTGVGLLMYIALEMSRLHQVFAYNEVVHKAFVPFQKVLANAYDVYRSIAMVLAPAACLAGGAALFNQIFGLPTFLGTLVMLVLTVLMCIFGAKFIRTFGTTLTVLMIVLILFITGFGVYHFRETIMDHISNRVMYTSYKSAFMYAWTYLNFQSGMWAVGVAAAVGIRYRNEARGAAFSGIVLNSLMLVAVCALLMGGMPTIASDPQAKLLPTLYMVNQLNIPFFNIAYPLLLFSALLTTSVGFVFTSQTRFSLLFLKNMENKKLKNAIISTGWLIIVWLVSQVGLLAIINKGYAASGWISMFLMIVPMSTLGIKNKMKYRKMEMEGLLPVGMDNRIGAEDTPAEGV